ncbi:MAG TPA: M56 family metallopeptidase [Mycobacterium sp.]|nr:M56 family metallopeptidase [Mycobacterium sp.]
MIAPVTLLLFAVMANSVGSRLLRDAAWTRRSPALAIMVWQALTVSIVMAVFLAGLALVFPSIPASASVAGFIEACASALRQQYLTPGGQALGAVGGFVAVAVAVRTIYFGAAGFRAVRSSRATQHLNLAVTSQPHPRWAVSVVEHDVAAAYCVPGRRARIVFTSAAMAQLDDGEVDAVIAHEHAHLHGHHDQVLAMFGALRRAFPRLAAMSIAVVEVAHLVEMRADDVALRGTGRFSLAKALVGLSEAPVPAGAVAASGSALARLQRLAEPPRPLTRIGGLFAVTSAFVLLLAPLAIAVEPAAVAAMMNTCPIIMG